MLRLASQDQKDLGTHFIYDSRVVWVIMLAQDYDELIRRSSQGTCISPAQYQRVTFAYRHTIDDF